jgi:signal transduction histidine kinase
LEAGVRVLRFILLLIVGLFFLANVVAVVEMAEVQQHNYRIVGNALASLADIARITQDLAEERILVDEHIFEKTADDRTRLEREIDRLDADYRRAARAYTPLATFPGERPVWERLQAQVEANRAPVADVLRLSRLNEDVQASERLQELRAGYDAISKDSEELIRINRNVANQAAARMNALQRQGLLALGGITVAGTALTLVAVAWVMRMAARRRDEIDHWADLLESRNRELDAFAGRVAHDLRGPLTTIGFSADELARRAPPGERTSEVLRRAIARMETLIADLLALSRVDAQTTTRAASDAAAVASTVEEDLAASVKKVDGHLRVDVEPATVRCSEGLLRQALWNLAENAVKYRRPEVPVEVAIEGREHDPSYEFRVSDNGAGMSREDARRVFEPFFRAEHTRATPGTGLGLSIVRRVVEANGGKIAVESQLGQGTTFILTLPLSGGS